MRYIILTTTFTINYGTNKDKQRNVAIGFYNLIVFQKLSQNRCIYIVFHFLSY